jgi:hypothetical protein
VNRDQAIKVDGAKELRKRLKAIEGGTAQLKKAGLLAAELVGDEAARLAPRRTGALAATVRFSGLSTGAVVRSGTRKVPYAGAIHFGWATRPNSAKGWRGGPIRPQPFLYDALDFRHEEVISTYQKQLDQIIQDNGL